MTSYPLLKNADLSGKKVLLRAGFDLPMKDGRVCDRSRVEAIVPTMKHILDAGASLIIMAHQGRPKGEVNLEFSQKPIVPVLEELLSVSVQFAPSCTGEETKKMADALEPGQVLLLENLRFDKGEKANDPTFASALSSLADIYVNDAFTNCHRPHASMVGVPALLPSFVGLTLEKEIENLSKILVEPPHPITLIVAGAKMETKVPVIKHYLKTGDDVLLGGCIATTFIAARGFDVGSSKYEAGELGIAREIMLESEKSDMAMVHVPRDAVLASSPDTHETIDLPLEDIEGDMAIFDIGAVSVKRYCEVIASSKTVIWNGPLGMYEKEVFAGASKAVAEAVRQATDNGAFTVIGGGDTIDFHNQYNLPLESYSFVSTGGGAMLEFIVGKKLPALMALVS